MLLRRAFAVAACAAMILAAPHSALTWGATGHRIIGRLAIETLPADLPVFLRNRVAVEAIGELAREPDRWKDAGGIHDTDRDPAHYLDLDDGGKVMGGPVLAALPATRADYDAALRGVGYDSWRAGYLPYSIVDGWQQLTKDFAYWRAETAAAGAVRSPAHRAWMAVDAKRREALILRDLGTLAHYVGDGSQPLHVSVHFNGWGPFPNPEGFTEDRVHAFFEGAFVRDFVDAARVRADMSPFVDCQCPVERRVGSYLAATNAEVVPFYQLQKTGGFQRGDARGRDFASARLAAAADELRDEIIEAWRASARGAVGYPEIKVADVLAGKVDPFTRSMGSIDMTEARIIDGRAIADGLREQVRLDVARLRSEHGVQPGLAVVLVGEDPASQIYVRSKGEQSLAAGMHSVTHRLAADTLQAEIEALVSTLNADPAIHGILVQLPLPVGIDAAAVIAAIDPDKDVDGLTLINAGRLASGLPGLAPCTPLGCLILLRQTLGELEGLEAVVVGRSVLVGRPVAQLLLTANCTVTIAHSKSRDLRAICRRSDILVAAVGKPGLVRGDWIKPGAAVIDVGVNRVPFRDPIKAAAGRTKVVGDVAFKEASAVAGWITPVPNGVGPMTVACLLRNTVTAARRQAGLPAD